MTKGHNQNKIKEQKENEPNAKGETKKLKDSNKEKSVGKGRKEGDPAMGKKGKNSI